MGLPFRRLLVTPFRIYISMPFWRDCEFLCPSLGWAAVGSYTNILVSIKLVYVCTEKQYKSSQTLSIIQITNISFALSSGQGSEEEKMKEYWVSVKRHLAGPHHQWRFLQRAFALSPLCSLPYKLWRCFMYNRQKPLLDLKWGLWIAENVHTLKMIKNWEWVRQEIWGTKG